MNHPLEQTLVRVRALSEYLKPELGASSGEGWIAHTDLVPGAVRLDALITATQARLRTRAPMVVGSAILQSYQWPLISTALACYLLDRRVPDLGATKTLTRYNAAQEADALALLSDRFTCLADDPAADHSDATVAPDLDSLRTAMRHAIEAHLGLVIDHLCARLGCKPRGLWLNVTDSCASTLVWLMQEQDKTTSMAQIEAEIAALIRVSGSPLTSRQIGLIQLSYAQKSRIFLDRATCCYWYKTDGGEYCSTCPHRTPDDRRQRLLAYLAETAATPTEPAVEEAVV
ncbi:MAG: IucA/IucC family C-terminal-domain containing protein [Chloroflexi bacterium OHK40]